MNVVIAPDSFKESMRAVEAAQAITQGFAEGFPEANIHCYPMADGGEGTAQTLLDALGGRWREITVCDPLRRPIRARYVLLDDGCAVIEMATAAGLHLLKMDERNPLYTDTYGVGELIADALDQGCRQIMIGLGGSATNDGGVGMLSALGWRFYDTHDQLLPPGGVALAKLAHIDAQGQHRALHEAHFTVACDVDHPLTGKRGASAVFARQKGASDQDIVLLDQALSHFAQLSADHVGYGFDQQAGAGAAGGLGFALCAYLQADICSGVALVAEAVGLEQAIAQADLVITGEGRMDGQTAGGKVPHGVLEIAQRHGAPVIALCGVLDADNMVLDQAGYTAILPIIAQHTEPKALLQQGPANLRRTAKQLARLLQRFG
ncbi:glycerate kinase [Suttonella sp. R2A3]|uniref:glycerate kinase n=1 Tax=Suttonella sp. R2A3 TaxID=2908648 RepID=UPI001F4755DC|nr:glycerate kinase [Suttonella sp. R2A3]UJF24110.1 glycerate kinase [Suttonella sp. R2A3]